MSNSDSDKYPKLNPDNELPEADPVQELPESTDPLPTAPPEKGSPDKTTQKASAADVHPLGNDTATDDSPDPSVPRRHPMLVVFAIVILLFMVFAFFKMCSTDDQMVKDSGDLSQTAPVPTAVATTTAPAIVSGQAAAPVKAASEPAQQPSPAPAAASSQSLDDIVTAVIHGDYGNNPQRRQTLGARYQEVQHAVNMRLHAHA